MYVDDSFLKVDVGAIDAAVFLREVGEMYALFDLAVHKHRMYKVTTNMFYRNQLEDCIYLILLRITGPPVPITARMH